MNDRNWNIYCKINFSTKYKYEYIKLIIHIYLFIEFYKFKDFKIIITIHLIFEIYEYTVTKFELYIKIYLFIHNHILFEPFNFFYI